MSLGLAKQRPYLANKPWSILAKAPGEIDISIMEPIGTDFWTGDGLTAKQFSEDLKAAGKVSKINLLVNSPGGSVWDGLAIANTLIAHPARVTSHILGLAASVASCIVMAADPGEISMSESSALMVHNPWSSASGDSKEFRKLADTLDKVKGSMIGMYQRHSRLSTEKISALLDDETWMDAEEAIENGFADTVTEAAAVAASVDLSRFKRVPVSIAARFSAYDSDESRRRKSRLRTMERHEMDIEDSRRRVMAMREIESANMRVPADEQRRRTMAVRSAEVRKWRREFEVMDSSEFHHQTLARRDRELGRNQRPTYVEFFADGLRRTIQL